MNKFLVPPASGLILAFFLTSGALAASIPVTDENKNLRPLGTGYNSRSSTLFQTCVDNTLDTDIEPVFKRENHSGSFSLKMESSQESLAKKFGVEAGGKYRSGATTTSASAEFLKEAKSDGYSIGYSYVSEHLFQETMTPTRARPIRVLPGFSAYLDKRDTFYERCGDEYVWLRENAARLFVNISVSFVSKSERNRFGAKFGISSPVVSFASSLENDVKGFSTNNQMSVRVIQMGGDPSYMGTLLCPKMHNGLPDPECANNAETAVNCSFGKIADCTKVIKNALAYASAQDGNNFPSQIREGKNYKVVRLETSPYVNLGTPFLTPPTEQNRLELEVALKHLQDTFEEYYSAWVYADKLYRGRAPRLTTRQKNEMEKLRTELDKRMRRSSLAINRCYDFGYSKCQTEVDEVNKMLRDEDGNLITGHTNYIERLAEPESLVQYCDMADDDHSEIKLTVDSLFEYAKNKLEKDQSRVTSGDKCYNLDEWFRAQETLDLSNFSDLKIGDLRPITVLSNLKVLNLSGKNLKNIDHLAELAQLKELYLDNNVIENLSPLTRLMNLTVLSIQNNKFSAESFAKLSHLNGTLESIDARGNGSDLVCPLENTSQCRILNFNNAINVTIDYAHCSMMMGHASAPFGTSASIATGGYALDGMNYFRNNIQLVTQEGCKPVTQKLHYPRAGHTMTKLNDDRIVIIGGYNRTIEVINPDLSIQLVSGSLSENRAMHTSTLLPDGRILIIGGYKDDMNFLKRSYNISATIDIFDPVKMKIEAFGKLHLPRAEHTATLLKDGRVLILGGYNNNKMINIAEIIDVKKKAVETLEEPLNVGRTAHSSLVMNDGKVLIIGGFVWRHDSVEGNIVNTLEATPIIEVFHPESESFQTLKEKFSPARGLMQTWTTPEGRIMLIGGETKGKIFDGILLNLPSASKTIQIYDPASQGIYGIGNLNVERAFFTATPIKSRSLVILGGVGAETAPHSSEVIVYRPKN